MLHLTINTGHTASLPRDLVRAETHTALAPILAAGGGPLPGGGAAYRIEIMRAPGSALFTFFRGRDPAQIPADIPWLTTLMLPALLLGTARRDIGFIGHMGACFGLMLLTENRT